MKQKAVKYDSMEHVLFCDKENPDNGYLMTKETYLNIKDLLESNEDSDSKYFVEAYKLEKIREDQLYDEYGVVSNTSIDFPLNRMHVPFLVLTR